MGPGVNLEEEPLRVPPSNGRPNFVRGLPASPSRAGHEPTPCDQGGIPSWIPRRSGLRGKPRGISTDRQASSGLEA